jgi:hypothetical protein
MGSPEAWGPEYQMAILACVIALPLVLIAIGLLLRGKNPRGEARWSSREGTALLGGFAWFLSALYLWHTKAEVWFTHYFHLAFWCWTLLVLFEIRARKGTGEGTRKIALGFPAVIGLVFLYGQVGQTIRLEATRTWHWNVYARWIDCIDHFLVDEYAKRGSPKVFRVWDPTFPDITIALSQRHPAWEFTRTNDFYSRTDLAVKHGYAADAMVVTEIFRPDEVVFQGKQSAKPQVHSVWMNWNSYFLNRLERDPEFKPERYLCQNGRWDAFIYLNR